MHASGGRGGRARVVAATGSVVAVVSLASAAGGAAVTDYASQSWNVLAPGQAGGLAPTRNSTDQANLYDGLTPLRASVSDHDLRRFFKRATLGLGSERAVSTERPRPGLLVQRDRWGVPHVNGERDVDVAFGAGWVTAQDRQPVLELLRGPGRLAALDVPGVDPLTAVLSGRPFVPSTQTEAFLARQFGLLERRGARGRRTIRLIDAYVAGINAWYRKAGLTHPRWTRPDVVAVGALLASLFGSGGGDETRRTNFLALLQQRLGAEGGRGVWEDLRLQQDPEARVAVDGSFSNGPEGRTELGNLIIDPGSTTAMASFGLAPTEIPRPSMSNALLVGARRSATGKPLLVAGPQVGYFYPGLLLELDLRGGGFEARGAAFPGVSFAILLGRGPDYAWSATSARLDLVDEYVETLCEGSDMRYLHRGVCRPMTTFDAGTLGAAAGSAEQRVVFRQTVHGPVVGYATVQGVKVAIARKRSTRGRELLAAPFLVDMSTAVPRSAREFVRMASEVELSFNWLYADHRDIAQFTSGRLPRRPPSVDPGLLTKGTGDFEWTGFVPPSGHAQGINPKSGVILNWNNRPARDLPASDAEWSWGSVQRVDLLWRAVQKRRRHTLGSLVASMNVAATQDLRAVRVWPTVRAVLSRAPAPAPQAEAAVRLVDEWVAAGGSRLDVNLDGRIDAPGAAVLDVAWPLLADAVIRDRLGLQTADLVSLVPPDDRPGPEGSAYGSGWYSYVDKDLRAVLDRPVRGPLTNSFCGRGDANDCADTLWGAVVRASTQLGQAQGSDPAVWRADATGERITFPPGNLTRTMRWTNRPTFQQAITFASHRPPLRRSR